MSLTKMVTRQVVAVRPSGIKPGCSKEGINRESIVIHRGERAILTPASEHLGASDARPMVAGSLSCVVARGMGDLCGGDAIVGMDVLHPITMV
jgi:hypothetical protein